MVGRKDTPLLIHPVRALKIPTAIGMPLPTVQMQTDFNAGRYAAGTGRTSRSFQYQQACLEVKDLRNARMFGLPKKKNPLVVVATLNARLRPLDRADVEDAFEAAMEQQRHRIRVVGGGTQLAPNGEVAECDIEIEIDGPSADVFEVISGTLGSILAPKGSSIYVPSQDRRLKFGSHEGLALYLNGTGLPDHVYRDYDSNYVYEECSRLLEGLGVVSSHWQGPTETAIYMYGWDFAAMRTRLTPFLQTYPLCRQCRVTQIA
jgi:hypothetical protein